MNINRLPKGLRAVIPFTIKRFLVRIYVRWVMRDCPGKSDKPRISFAEILPPKGVFIRGGKVKLTHLRKEFGEYKRGFNILYLVSSTLPGFADIWVSEARRKGVRVVWNQNGIGTPAWSPIWQKINNSMKPLSQADYVIYQSNFAKIEADDMVAKASGPWMVITNCCDTDIFKPADTPLPMKPFKIMVMGTAMTPEKMMIPIESLKIVLDRGLDAELLLYGPAEWPNAQLEIDKRIEELGLEGRVKRHGKYLQNQAANLMRDGHIYIHTKHMDSSPTAILEAIACGLPVIGSKSGGVAEWITSGSGITLEVPISRDKLYYPTPEAIADSIETISKDWRKWSVNARAHALKYFGVADWIEKHKKVFDHVINK